MIEDMEIERLNKDKLDELASLKHGVCREIGEIMDGKTVKQDVEDSQGNVMS